MDQLHEFGNRIELIDEGYTTRFDMERIEHFGGEVSFWTTLTDTEETAGIRLTVEQATVLRDFLNARLG